VDGANEENRELRNELFAISGKRGLYPQFFIAYGGHYFVSLFHFLCAPYLNLLSP